MESPPFDIEYPTLPDQELGGWVYEKAYLSFRFPPAEGLTGEALDDYMENQMGSLLEALEDILQPGIEEHLAWEYAIELFIDYKRYGLPLSGGYAEQDAEQMYILDCMITAQERAERETRAADAKMRNQNMPSMNENEIETSDMGGVPIGE